MRDEPPGFYKYLFYSVTILLFTCFIFYDLLLNFVI